jgi:hypothetical protein
MLGRSRLRGSKGVPAAWDAKATAWAAAADGKVRLLEVSLYAKGPRKGDVCPDVAFHEEMPKIPSRYTWNNTPHPCVHGPWSRKSRQTKWINTLVEKINLQKNQKQKEKLSFPGGSQSNPDGTM